MVGIASLHPTYGAKQKQAAISAAFLAKHASRYTIAFQKQQRCQDDLLIFALRRSLLRNSFAVTHTIGVPCVQVLKMQNCP